MFYIRESKALTYVTHTETATNQYMPSGPLHTPLSLYITLQGLPSPQSK